MVEEKFKLGKELLLILDQQDEKPTACFWFYLAENDFLRLVIAYKGSGVSSTSDAYRKFIGKFGNNDIVKEIGLYNIMILMDNDGFINLLRTAITTGPDSISGIRFSSNVINGVMIDDAYIYRL